MIGPLLFSRSWTLPLHGPLQPRSQGLSSSRSRGRKKKDPGNEVGTIARRTLYNWCRYMYVWATRTASLFSTKKPAWKTCLARILLQYLKITCVNSEHNIRSLETQNLLTSRNIISVKCLTKDYQISLPTCVYRYMLLRNDPMWKTKQCYKRYITKDECR